MTTESTQKMIVQWCNLIEKGDGHQAKIDMGCYAEELTLGVIERVIFGAHYKEAREVFAEGKEIQKLAVRAFADPRIPGLRYKHLQELLIKHWTGTARSHYMSSSIKICWCIRIPADPP